MTVATGQTKALLPTDLKHHGIILQKHSTIHDLYTLSGPNAKANEFQMHYWMLVFRHTFEDGGFFDVAVPTCYFNYEQFVTSAHVDFEMKDVAELSEKLVPLHNMITNQILATQFHSELEALFGLKFEPLSVDVGTLHRHPGTSFSQRFSGTDLDANNTNHGIVFPLKSGTDKPSFSGILAIDGGICNVAHYEYRIVNGGYETNDMTYTKGRCLAITHNNTYTPPVVSSIQRFFGVVNTEIPMKTKEDQSLIPTQIVKALDSLISLLPDANTQLVRSENVKVKTYTPTTLYGHNYKATTKPYAFNLALYDYPIHTLRYNLEAHYKYHDMPIEPTKLDKLTKPQLEQLLLEVYAKPEKETKPVEPPKTEKTFGKQPPKTGFMVCDLQVYTEEELLALSRDKLLQHHDELDLYYYGKASPSLDESEPDITNQEIIDYITELYVCIYDEEKEALSTTGKPEITNIKSDSDDDNDRFGNYDDWIFG